MLNLVAAFIGIATFAALVFGYRYVAASVNRVWAERDAAHQYRTHTSRKSIGHYRQGSE